MESIREIITRALDDPDADIIDPATINRLVWPTALVARAYPALSFARTTGPVAQQPPERWTAAINALVDVAGQAVRMLSEIEDLEVEEAIELVADAATTAVSLREVELTWTPARWVVTVQWAMSAFCATCAYEVPGAAPSYMLAPDADTNPRLLVTIAALSSLAALALQSTSGSILTRTDSGLLVPASV